MTISIAYERYLSHFKETVTLKDFNQQADTPGLCALRHDVDHDLDLALEMAHKEHKLGFKASYFILPSAPYWQSDERLVDKCLQLQDYGHEVGLHVNSMAEWVSGTADDIKASLSRQLDFLRDGGIDLTGIAAHGDKLCYEHNLSNYWCFEELRPADPYAAENGRTAEGPYEADMTPRLLYPSDHIARRSDGTKFDLWSISMANLGLEYHAWHTKFDQYFSDSTGGWKRSPDPLNTLRGNERWQVLIHPEHWRGPKKYYFFLSSARSGSKWLSEVLSAATPLQARHEYLLNQPFHRGETSRKATADVWALEDNIDEVTARLTEAWEEFENQPRDFAEVNVYLEDFSEKLKEMFPDATYIQLKRDPCLVISSLMDRNWYDTPEDKAHPRLTQVDAQDLDQFERICHYVAQVDERLGEICTVRLHLDQIVSDPSALSSQLESLGIAYHARLGKDIFGRIVNARKQVFVSGPSAWTPEQLSRMQEIFSGTEQREKAVKDSSHSRLLFVRKAWDKARYIIENRLNPKHYQLNLATARMVQAKLAEVHYDRELNRLAITPDVGNFNALVALGGSSWREAQTRLSSKTGWRSYPGAYVKGYMAFDIAPEVDCRVYVVHYDASGKAIYRKNLGAPSEESGRVEFTFGVHPAATSIDFILYIPVKSKAPVFYLTECRFEWVN